jgi:hypothetical protein
MGEIRTVKGRERERATAVERVVVTAETEIAWKINAQTASQPAWYVCIGCIQCAACVACLPTVAPSRVAPLNDTALIARTDALE